MKGKDLLLLALLEALVLGAVAFFQHSPGYMDAAYYTVMGRQLAAGQATEPFLWNYLDDPVSLPHPAFAYWQPLAAAVAAWGFRWGGDGFAAAQAPFWGLALLVPPLTALLAYRLSHRRDLALMSGALAVASAFYLPYLPIPDTFTPLLVIGALFFLILSWPLVGASDASGKMAANDDARAARLYRYAPFALGALAGLLYLARGEGLVWLLAAWGGLAFSRERRWASYGQVLLGFALVAVPWMARNVRVFGTPLSPAGGRVLWLTHYNELYDYPATHLTFAHWWDAGWRALAEARLHAMATNFMSALAVQGAVVWFPWVVIGLWRLRRWRPVAVGAAMWGLLWGVMSLVFPLAGERGGFFHAGAVVQPLLWAVAPVGFAAALRPLARWRGWHQAEAERVLGWGMIALAVLLSAWVVQRRVVGRDAALPKWDQEARHYAQLVQGMAALGVPEDALVLVNNPPCFYWVTGRPSLAVPNASPQGVAEVARRYGARYWLLEADHPKPLNHPYCHPTTVPPPWRFVGMVDKDTPLFVLEVSP